MTKKYTHLQPEQRYKIEGFLQVGKTISEIAVLVGVHKSTISRELRRNIPKRGKGSLIYKATNAQKKTMNRHHTKAKHHRFTEEMKTRAREWLKEDKLSPELIAAKGKKEQGYFVSHETIYEWIWSGKHSHRRDRRKDKLMHRFLKHNGRRRKRGNQKDNRGLIQHRVSIEKRPEVINQRKRIGDVEADLVLGKNHQPGLLIVTDRKLRMNWLEKIENKKAEHIEMKLRKIIKRCKHQVKSITFDNDLAFGRHFKIKKDLNIKTYFTHPYTSQEKGTVENRIGVLRRFFPKKTDFTKVTISDISEVEVKLNNRPMRMFKYASPKEIYEKKVLLRC